TGVNADPGFTSIKRAFTAFHQKYPDKVALVQSMGQQRYLSAMRLASVVIGNSSSGIIEAPALGVQTINIGDRQKGRLRADSIIDCDNDMQSIIESIHTVLKPENQKKAKHVVSLYGAGEASPRIVETLITQSLDNILMKQFFDMTE
ncbi:UDP-N-acetylglucosamine 2-epimerase (hydrolyzing), partial [archaeon]|nr:UDP-N-acetylglucosamine 2-epimerase (hydrolyzing) [archaeon]